MLRLLGTPTHACDGLTRRELLRAGGLTLFGGMTLPRFLRAAAEQPARSPARARAVILLNLFGGPSHLDTFDMKPAAPPEIRGEFQPIPTSVPGLRICEHLPQVARLMHRACLIRTVSHRYNSHNPYAVLTGFDGGSDRENYFAKPTDHPSIGSVCQYLGAIRRGDLPSYVCLPAVPGYSQGLRRAGPYGGYLGKQYDPLFSTCNPTFEKEFDQDQAAYDPIPPFGAPVLPSLEVSADLTTQRLRGRRTLLGQLDGQLARLEAARAPDGLGYFQRQAFTLLTSSRARAAFDLAREPAKLRERYGNNLFGSSLLVARRLVEAGVTFVAVHTESRGGGHWDSHEKNFHMLKKFLLPMVDQVYPALIEDLEARGLLESTLVVVMGEMGRTPRVNARAGRDHWPQCGFSLLTGGGVKAGLVYGTSDKQGAYPLDRPVSMGDLAATIYQLLGVDPTATVPDFTGRPVSIAHGGAPVWEVLA
jgi:hypothetical protein